MSASDRCACGHAEKQHHGTNGEFACRIAILCGCFQPDYTQGERDRLAALLDLHRLTPGRRSCVCGHCGCGRGGWHFRHVAAVLLAAGVTMPEPKRMCQCGHDIGTHFDFGQFRDQCRAMVPNDLFNDGQGLCQCKKFREISEAAG